MLVSEDTQHPSTGIDTGIALRIDVPEAEVDERPGAAADVVGHAELGISLRDLAGAVHEQDWWQAVERANDLLDAASTESPALTTGLAETADLIGGVVTRAGPVAGVAISRAERAALERLDLRPVYVGIHREVVSALIEGGPALVEQALVLDKLAGEAPSRSDRAGGWIISLDDTSDP